MAEEKTNNKKEWEFDAEIYFWGASIGGKSASGSDIDVEIDDILDNLKFAVMGVAAVRKGKWSRTRGDFPVLRTWEGMNFQNRTSNFQRRRK